MIVVAPGSTQASVAEVSDPNDVYGTPDYFVDIAPAPRRSTTSVTERRFKWRKRAAAGKPGAEVISASAEAQLYLKLNK